MEEGGAGGSDGTRPASQLSDVRCGACSNPQPGSITTAADAVSAQTPHDSHSTALCGALSPSAAWGFTRTMVTT